MVLAVSDADDSDRSNWVLGSGASRHLVNEETLLIDSAKRSQEIAMAVVESLHLTRDGSVRLKILVRNFESTVTLTDVYLELGLTNDSVLYDNPLRRK